MFSLTLVVSLGAVGARAGPWLQQFSDGKLFVHGRLAAQNVQAVVCTHFTPRHCIQHWGVIRGTGPAVMTGPVFLVLPPEDNEMGGHWVRTQVRIGGI